MAHAKSLSGAIRRYLTSQDRGDSIRSMPQAHAREANTSLSLTEEDEGTHWLLGLFSPFEGARQEDLAGARDAQGWCWNSACRQGGPEKFVDPSHHQPPSSHKGPLDAPDSQKPAELVQEVWPLCGCWQDVQPSQELAWGLPSRPCAPHSSHGFGSLFCWAASCMCNVWHSPALCCGGADRRGSLPASAQGSPRTGKRLEVARPLPPG